MPQGKTVAAQAEMSPAQLVEQAAALPALREVLLHSTNIREDRKNSKYTFLRSEPVWTDRSKGTHKAALERHPLCHSVWAAPDKVGINVVLKLPFGLVNKAVALLKRQNGESAAA